MVRSENQVANPVRTNIELSEKVLDKTSSWSRSLKMQSFGLSAVWP